MHIVFKNKAQDSSEYTERKFPRPGHADFVAEKKYKGFQDPRGGGFFSGRMTVLLVAAGVIAKKTLGETVNIKSEISSVGGEKCFDALLEETIQNKDSLGAQIKCVIDGLPVGLGEPAFSSVESLISHMVFSIPGAKAIAFGSGFDAHEMKGSEFNDVILDESGKTSSNHNGGINGGITNGNFLEFSVNFKPTSSIGQFQKTWNPETGNQEDMQIHGKHDVCYALRAPVIVEAVSAIVLTDLYLQHKARN